MKRLFTMIIASLLALLSAIYLSIAEETRNPDGTIKRTISQDSYDASQCIQRIAWKEFVPDDSIRVAL